MFKHDSTRGKWSSDLDFYLACISHAFGVANFSLLPVVIMMHGGVFFIALYTISFVLFTIPIFFIQSFLGQFSSTGFISVYRISPLFKGIGFVILVLNIISACVNSVTAAYVLTYFFASLSIDLPWMSCNHTWNNKNCKEVFPNLTEESDFFDISWSTAEYFQLKILNLNSEEHFYGMGWQETKMAWPIFGSSIVVWITVGLILYQGIETVAKFIEYSAVVIFSILIIIFIRFACLPGAIEGIIKVLTRNPSSIEMVPLWMGAPFLAASFGIGWGTVLTMSSFNKFKANIMNNIIVISLTLFVASILAVLLISLADEYLKDQLRFGAMSIQHHPFNFLLVGFPYIFGNMEASQMWSLMFYLMLTLGELSSLIIIIFTSLTSLFDEYEYLRDYKRHIYIGLPSILFPLSIIFTTNRGYELYDITIRLCGTSQMGICCLELIIVVWIYGRQRFQRDVQLMFGRKFATWKFYLIRFITPIFIILAMLTTANIAIYDLWSLSFAAILILFGVIFSPWIVFPGYIIAKMIATSGSIKARIIRCVQPNDWYPADSCDRHENNSNLLPHQLVTTV